MNFEEHCEKALARIARNKSAPLAPAPGLRPSAYAAMLDMGSVHNYLMHIGAENFFLGVLRSFSVTPTERREMEAAARYFSVRSKRLKLPSEGWETKYREHWEKLERMYTTACKVVKRGEACRDDQFCTARCFRIVNTGGFDLKTMQVVQKVVDRAARAVDESGFGALCYGDVNVTNTVQRNSKVLAFYMISEDRMYVRANLKGLENEAAATIVHELGHRLDHKFMSADDRIPVRALYRKYLTEDRAAGESPRVEGGAEPKIGDLFEHKNERFQVVRVSHDKVFMRPVDPALGKFELQLAVDGWRLRHGGRAVVPKSAFPSQYSKKDLGEFFAEMFAFALLDKLSPEQGRDFDPILEMLAEKLAATEKKAVAGMARGRAAARRSPSESRGAARGDSEDPLRRLEQEGALVEDKLRGRGLVGGTSKYVVTLFDAGGTPLRRHRVSSASEARALERKLSADYEGMGAFALTEPNV